MQNHDAERPPELICHDVGGWISGPCLDPEPAPNALTEVPSRSAFNEPADVDDDVECEPNSLGFCRWCGRDLTGGL